MPPSLHRRLAPLAGAALLAGVVVLVVPAACTHPPAAVPATARPIDRSTEPPADCDAPPVANEPEGCHDDAARPPDAPPAERPGVDRDGDGVEDILDVCPDQHAAPSTDADGDGCTDGAGTATS